MATRYTIQDMQFYAKQMGGKCLSKAYINADTPLAWMCDSGHTWDMRPSLIVLGSWCRQCVKRSSAQDRLKELHRLAQQRGGKCLSAKYENKLAKLKWQCAHGHVWLASSARVKNGGKWCWKCLQNSRCESHWKKIQQRALSKGGLCLSTEYSHGRNKLLWQCKNGHQWLSRANHIMAGNWCAKCQKIKAAKLLRDDISIYQKLARKRDGKLLSTVYLNNVTPLKWQCAKGHVWMANAATVKHQGSWCLQCSGKAKHTIEEMNALARKRKGKCLSSEYINVNSPLEWQCKKRLVFRALPASVLVGHWCQACAGKLKSKNIIAN